ncbi:hypothetical protein [Streptomyces sp. NRRL F-5630]|uniref:hypothetical protein n=1 Tax=Streptomyces sp. NRRL F-5630 TaxID=1463864 RepID=UPI003D731912
MRARSVADLAEPQRVVILRASAAMTRNLAVDEAIEVFDLLRCPAWRAPRWSVSGGP